RPHAHYPSDGPDATVERQLPDRQVAPERRRRQVPVGAEDGKGYRKVERRTLLAYVGRCQVHDDPTGCQRQTELLERSSYAFARLLHCGSWQPDDGEVREAPAHEGLDPDQDGLDTDDGSGCHDGVHRLDDRVETTT